MTITSRSLILWKILCEAAITNPATIAPIIFLMTTKTFEEVIILSDIKYMLLNTQKVKVIHPIIPAIIDPNLAPFLTKNIANKIPKYHTMANISQRGLNI